MKLLKQTSNQQDVYVCYNPQVKVYAVSSQHYSHEPSIERRTEHIQEAWYDVDLEDALAAMLKLEEYSGLLSWEVHRVCIKVITEYTAVERINYAVTKEPLQ